MSGRVKAGHRIAELECIENVAAGDGSRTSLIVGDRDGWAGGGVNAIPRLPLAVSPSPSTT